MNKKLSIFEGKEIRKVIFNNEWYFSVVDVVGVLIEQYDNTKARKYWNKLAERLRNEGSEVVTKCHQLKLKAQDGKMRLTDCASTEILFRIIQSIPSPKAEPFKLWLAKIGNERIKEIENPELAMQRMMDLYEKKGYPKDWIDARTRGIQVRKGLTEQWSERDVLERDYGILTNEIYKAFSGMNNEEYKNLKSMKKSQNLRDGMTTTELILTMLAEQATKDITNSRDTKGLENLKKDSKDGGTVAFKARKELIEQTGKDPITKQNFLEEVKKIKRIK